MTEQFYGIKYPFSEESERLTYLDLNESKEESVRSMILHIIFTPKGQRLRRPDFGTNLIKFIFDPNDSTTWDSVKEDIRKQISLYLPDVVFNDIIINHGIEEGEMNVIFVEVNYTVNQDGERAEYKTMVRI